MDPRQPTRRTDAAQPSGPPSRALFLFTGRRNPGNIYVLLLQRYIFRLLLRNFLLVLFAITAFIFLTGMVQSLGRYQDLSLSLLLSRVPFLIPSALALAIPLALLVGTLLTYGRLSADNEILAIRMAGIHPRHAITPALVLGLSLVLVTLLVNGTIAPVASLRARQVRKDDLRKFLDSLEERRVYHFQTEGVRMYWRGVDPDGWLVGFGFELPAKDSDESLEGEASLARITRDPAAEMLTFDLRDVTIVAGGGKEDIRQGRLVLSYSIVNLFGVDAELEKKELLTSRELRYRVYRDPQLGRRSMAANLVRFRVEYCGRIALAMSCLIFVLLGAPIGVLFRRGSFVGSTLVALLVAFVVYYPLHELGKSLVYHRGASPTLALAIPDLVLGVVGIVLLSRVLSR